MIWLAIYLVGFLLTFRASMRSDIERSKMVKGYRAEPVFCFMAGLVWPISVPISIVYYAYNNTKWGRKLILGESKAYKKWKQDNNA
jgi:hypothetical protein